MDFTISNENIYRETCQLCGVRFSRADILAVHIEFVHNYLEKNMQQVSKLGYSSMTTVVEHSEAQPTESKISLGIVVKTEGVDQTGALSAVPLPESVAHSLSKMQQVSTLGYSSMATVVETSEAQPTEISTSPGVVMKTQGGDHIMHLSAVPLPESVAHSLSKMQQVSTLGYSSMTKVVETSEAQPTESSTSPGVVMKTQGCDQTMNLSAVPLPESVSRSLSKMQQVPKLGYSRMTTVVEHSEAQPLESRISPGIVVRTKGVDQTVPLSAVPLPESVVRSLSKMQQDPKLGYSSMTTVVENSEAQPIDSRISPGIGVRTEGLDKTYWPIPLPKSVLRSLSKMQLPYLEKSEIGPDIGPEICSGIGSKICPKIGPEVCPEIGQKLSIPVSLPVIISRQASKELLSENMEVIENINKNNQSVDEILVSQKGSKDNVQNTGVLFLLCHER